MLALSDFVRHWGWALLGTIILIAVAGRLALAKPDVTVLHPGPMNRGLEISWEVGYCDNAAIRDEVQNGVAVRMALLFLTLTGGKQIENID